MKKSIFSILALTLTILTLVFQSCKKENDEIKPTHAGPIWPGLNVYTFPPDSCTLEIVDDDKKCAWIIPNYSVNTVATLVREYQGKTFDTLAIIEKGDTSILKTDSMFWNKFGGYFGIGLTGCE